MSRVALADVQRLTFHKDAKTKGRRLPPIQELKCIGKACKLYEPEVVRCHNAGGEGTDVDWTCEADLPDKLRFGRVSVSCEGWSYSGDPFVLKGSCGLEYHLVRLPGSGAENKEGLTQRLVGSAFTALTIALFAYIMYTLIRACCGSRPNHPGSGSTGSSGPGGSGFWRRGSGGDTSPPPPYSYNPTYLKPTSADSGNSQFWTGAALGALGGATATRLFQRGSQNDNRRQERYQQHDWEQDRPHQSDTFSMPQRRTTNSDRGEGSSGLGQLRTSTGYGTSNVR